MDRPTPWVSELVRLAVEICDRDGRDPALGRFEEQLEDDDAPVTAWRRGEARRAMTAIRRS